MMLTTIGRYQIKKELGRGGMATVYLAHDPRFNRDVAIKLLPHELLHQPTFRARFEREAKIVAALDIPAIVPVYDYGEEDGQPYLVMRYMAGGSLSDRLQAGGMSLMETARIINILAPALDEAHKRGIIHRDLKPSNILFDQNGTPYISDFGTALITQSTIQLTDTGGAVGTPAYMSPEQIRGERTLDGRSDLYALGIITFEMLTGGHPYQTDTPIGVAVRHIIDPVPRILDTQPNLPAQCQTIITQAMSKQREGRYTTAVAFAQALNQAALVSMTGVSYQQEPQRERLMRRFLPLLRHNWSWAVILLLLVALFIVSGKNRAATNAAPTTVTAVAHNTATATPSPTTTRQAIAPTQTKIPPTPTSLPTATATIPATPTKVAPETPTTITASQSATIFNHPDPNSAQLAIILTGENITIEGQSENGHWLYVRNDNDVSGFVYASLLNWQGDINTLSIIQPPDENPPVITSDTCEGDCPSLWLDAYPLPGSRCEAGVAYRTVYLRGQDGSGIYTYYWNDDYVAGPLTNEGAGFEVRSLGGIVIGTGKVVSSDGQEVEQELFITDFECD
jgi:serine/threonine protein kinase